MRPSPLDALYAVYERLSRRDPATLSHHQRRSVQHYLAETRGRASLSQREGALDHITRWACNLFALETFIAREGRWPRENNRLPAGAFAPDEQRLANWVRSERRATQALRRCSYQRLRLAAISGYTHATPDQRWEARRRDYEAFTQDHGRAPSLRRSPDEKRLARWAAKQRFQRRSGSLPKHRETALGKLSFWTWGPSQSSR
jgi:hypothetical protein